MDQLPALLERPGEIVRQGEVRRLDVPAVAMAFRDDLVRAVADHYDDIVCELRDDPRTGKLFYFRAVRSRR